VLTIRGKEIPLATDGDGKIEREVLHDESRASLAILGRELGLRIGNLNPVEKAPDGGVSGAKGRLKNLGYNIESTSGPLDAPTRTALALFQHDHKLDVTGELDAPTKKKLEEEHGC
jgi:hypothetical protein